MDFSGIHDPDKANDYRLKGNVCFKTKDYVGAEALYTKAINHEPTNPLLYTNRANALLKLSLWESVITDSLQAISITPNSMKAYYLLAQAEIALHRTAEALESSKKAHAQCVSDIETGTGKDPQSSLQMITDLVLRCKKEDWERKEKERVRGRNGLLDELVADLKAKMEKEDEELRQGGAGNVELEEARREYEGKIEMLKRTFEAAAGAGSVANRRKVPDWILDDITFGVMFDPMVTKTGQSYDRASIYEHLKRSQTDPLTREPMKFEDLRPNLALKEACGNFLDENGWAVDW